MLLRLAYLGVANALALLRLVRYLAERRALLVLDNCEHLIPAVAVLTGTLLASCAQLRVLATSREPLTITGETIFAVPPLPTPAAGARGGLAEVGRWEAVALFVARARGAAPEFHVTADNHGAVAELCVRLDGLPLAIELAAARVRALAPAQILQRLAERFTLLSRGSRSAPERQQTLQACVDWSFELCTKPERVLWARLSVFVGGCELDAIEGVCADEVLPVEDLLDVVAGLVDKSVLISENVAGNSRYRLLETLRDFGQDKLIEAGERDELRRRHRDWYQQLTARAHVEWVSDRQVYWLARLGREHPNLRAVVQFCLTEPGEAEAALRLAVNLPVLYLLTQGMLGEGRSWLDRALAQLTAPTPLRARALVIDSHLAFSQGDVAAAMRLLDEGEELARHLDAAAPLAYAAFLRGERALHANDLPAAVETFNRARMTLSRSPDSELDLSLYLLTGFGLAAGLAGDDERADACMQELLVIVEPRGEGIHLAYALFVSGLIAWLRGDHRRATAQVVEALRGMRRWEWDDRYMAALCLEVLAWTTADQLHHRRADTLLGAATGLGAADMLWTEMGPHDTTYLHLVGHHPICERRIRDGLGDAAFADAFHHGQVLSYDDAIAYALQEPRQPAPRPLQDAATPLTRREQQVADLIALGLSNKDIAAKLVISQRTAESHVEHILTKLGATSRAQVAAWKAAQQSRDQDS